MQGVDGEAEGCGAGDVCGGDGDAFGRGEAETAGGDGGVQAEGFVDGAIEVREGVEGSGVGGCGGIGIEVGEFGAYFRNARGGEGEVVE